MHSIVLGYRRNDQPGYVSRLADNLEDRFGTVVFRDVDSILAGDKWNQVLRRKVSSTKLVIAVIGSGWASELRRRDDSPDTDYVRLELQTARETGIPVVPVLLDNTPLPNDDVLGELAWIRNIQTHHLSDSQGRWNFDVSQLMHSVTIISDIKPKNSIKLKTPLLLTLAAITGFVLALTYWNFSNSG